MEPVTKLMSDGIEMINRLAIILNWMLQIYLSKEEVGTETENASENLDAKTSDGKETMMNIWNLKLKMFSRQKNDNILYF